METSIQVSVISNPGLIRSNNEDNFYIDGTYMKEKDRDNGALNVIKETKPHHLIAVFDGMGGEELGELASITAVRSLSHMDQQLAKAPVDRPLHDKQDEIKAFVNDTNDMICSLIEQHGKVRMGTTASCLYLYGDRGMVFHLGDSRIYRFRDGMLEQLTSDHTEAQRLVRLGVLSEAQAQKHRSRHQLTRHFGVFPQEGIIEADISQEFHVYESDIFLLCSDGLTDMISDDDISAALRGNVDIAKTNYSLLRQALDKGGHDNITSLLVKVDGIGDKKVKSSSESVLRSILDKLYKYNKYDRGEKECKMQGM